MKHRLLYLSMSVALSCASVVKAQSTYVPIDCTDLYWGSYARYPEPKTPLTPQPAEYEPVFINYVGRNGSTFSDVDVSKSFVYITLHKADSLHALKDDGKKLREMLQLIQRIEKGKSGITQSGSDEIAEIALRMKDNFKPVFASGKCIKVSSVDQKPMLQSAEVFVKNLGSSIDAPGCDKIDLKDDDNLAPFKVSPALKTFAEKGDWKEYADDYRESHKPKNYNIKFLGRFFEPVFLEDFSDDDQSKFIADMFNLGQHVNSIKTDMLLANVTLPQIDIRSFFECPERDAFYRANSTGDFYKSGPGSDKTGMQMRSAVPLLINLLNTTDAYSIEQKAAVHARFTSSESIVALAGLLNFEGFNKISKDANKVDWVWKAEDVIPSSANIQLVFYKGTTADTRSYYLVKFLLNEVEMRIEGLSHRTSQYYLWDDVKALLKRKLAEEMDVDAMNQNMHTYLLNLKP